MSDEKKAPLSDDALNEVAGGLSKIRYNAVQEDTLLPNSAQQPAGMTTWPPHITSTDDIKTTP